MAEKEIELTYNGLKNMKKNDFAKLFKKPAPWKKAQGVLFLAKYKFSNGKVSLVAIPFKKYNDAAKCFKNEVKIDNIYSSKLTMLTHLEQNKDKKGNLKFKVTPTQGSMNADYLNTYGKELFGKLKIEFTVAGCNSMMNNTDLGEVVEAAKESLSNKKSDLIVAKQKKRAKKATKISQSISKFEKAIGKVEAPKLQEKLTLYKQILKELDIEANKDNQVNTEEKKELKRILHNIQQLELLVKNVTNANKIAKNIQETLYQLQK
jgi:hypothetical protein